MCELWITSKSSYAKESEWKRAQTRKVRRLAIMPNCTTTWPINGHNCARRQTNDQAWNRKTVQVQRKVLLWITRRWIQRLQPKFSRTRVKNKCKRQNMRNRRSPTPVATIDEKFARSKQKWDEQSHGMKTRRHLRKPSWEPINRNLNTQYREFIDQKTDVCND